MEVFDRAPQISAFAEALLYLSARVDNVVRFIAPALDKGRVVIADRFVDSWIAYWAPVLGPQLGSTARATKWLLDFDNGLRSRGLSVRPNRTFLLIDDPSVATKRAPAKVRSKWENARHLRRVQAVYLDLARRFPGRFRIYDLRERGLRATASTVVEEAAYYIGETVRL